MCNILHILWRAMGYPHLFSEECVRKGFIFSRVKKECGGCVEVIESADGDFNAEIAEKRKDEALEARQIGWRRALRSSE